MLPPDLGNVAVEIITLFISSYPQRKPSYLSTQRELSLPANVKKGLARLKSGVGSESDRQEDASGQKHGPPGTILLCEIKLTVFTFLP